MIRNLFAFALYVSDRLIDTNLPMPESVDWKAPDGEARLPANVPRVLDNLGPLGRPGRTIVSPPETGTGFCHGGFCLGVCLGRDEGLEVGNQSSGFQGWVGTVAEGVSV